MSNLPDTLEEATSQAIAATFSAIENGNRRLIVDIKFPELDALPVGYEFALKFCEVYGDDWQALFSDAGSAALAKRNWGLEISTRGVNEGRAAVKPEDRAFLLVSPSSIEVDQIEKLVELAGDRPFVMLNPRLENSEVGLGLSARRLRDRFLSTFELCYYIQPLAQGALWRDYPQNWQVWQQAEVAPEFEMSLLQEFSQKPTSEELDRLFQKTTGKSTSFLGQLQRFLNSLSR
jgi:hypothetical protein